MKFFLSLALTVILMTNVHAGVKELNPLEEREALQLYQRVCGQGEEGANLGTHNVHCKRSKEQNIHETLNHQVNVQGNAQQQPDYIYIQPPQVNYQHNILLNGSPGQQATRIYILPQKSNHQISTNYNPGQISQIKPVVYFLKDRQNIANIPQKTQFGSSIEAGSPLPTLGPQLRQAPVPIRPQQVYNNAVSAPLPIPIRSQPLPVPILQKEEFQEAPVQVLQNQHIQKEYQVQTQILQEEPSHVQVVEKQAPMQVLEKRQLQVQEIPIQHIQKQVQIQQIPIQLVQNEQFQRVQRAPIQILQKQPQLQFQPNQLPIQFLQNHHQFQGEYNGEESIQILQNQQQIPFQFQQYGLNQFQFPEAQGYQFGGEPHPHFSAGSPQGYAAAA